MKRTPVSLINWGDKIPNSFTNIFEVFKIIQSHQVNLFVRNIPCHKVERILDIFSVQYYVFNWSMKRDRMKITASEFWFSRSLKIIRELDVDNIDVLIVCSRSMYSFLLVCLIRQSRSTIYHFIVYNYIIVVFHSIVVCNQRLSRRHWWVPRAIFFSREGSISYLVIIVRRGSYKKVHPYIVQRKHSW